MALPHSRARPTRKPLTFPGAVTITRNRGGARREGGGGGGLLYGGGVSVGRTARVVWETAVAPAVRQPPEATSLWGLVRTERRGKRRMVWAVNRLHGAVGDTEDAR